MEAGAYLETVRSRLVDAGFEPEDPAPGVALQARKRAVKVSRFGLVETVVSVSRPQATAQPEDLRSFGAEVIGTALERKSKIPRGLGSSMVVYPALVVEEAGPELRQFVAEHVPKHWSVLEFPVVVETRSGTLLSYAKTPIWGAAYYRKTRQQAQALFDPKQGAVTSSPS